MKTDENYLIGAAEMALLILNHGYIINVYAITTHDFIGIEFNLEYFPLSKIFIIELSIRSWLDQSNDLLSELLEKITDVIENQIPAYIEENTQIGMPKEPEM